MKRHLVHRMPGVIPIQNLCAVAICTGIIEARIRILETLRAVEALSDGADVGYVHLFTNIADFSIVFAYRREIPVDGIGPHKVHELSVLGGQARGVRSNDPAVLADH